MLVHLLKKDLMKRKGINLILFLFITLATVFVSSSVNNILIVSSAVEYYMDYAKVPDVNVITSSEEEKNRITNWIKDCQAQGIVEEFDYNTFIALSDKAVAIENAGASIALDSKGASIYLSTQDVDFVRAYDLDGEEFTLNQGEIALPLAMMERNQLKIGDQISITSGDVKKQFTINMVVKDAAFGNEMVGMARLIVHPQDFKELEVNSSKFGLYYVMTDDSAGFIEALGEQGFRTLMNSVGRSMYSMVYSFDMIFAGLLILIGVCLILIALLVLRFTLVFTMEEQYQEIGILKAIGLKNRSIKKLYLIKYLAIVSLGALIGLLISIPVSQAMINSVSQNMIMEQSEANLGINVISALCVVALVLSFCYFCTRKLNKVSAITAIRSGDSGERFTKVRGLSLSKHHHMSIAMYLGINDILSHVRRYAVLIITFCISFLLITIPLNTLHTMQSAEMVKKFMLDPNSAVYVRNIEQGDEEVYNSTPKLKKGMTRLQAELKDKGYDVKLSAEAIFFLRYAGKGEEKRTNIMTLQLLDKQNAFEDYSEGSAPMLENEIAFSKPILQGKNWAVGDYVNVNINGIERTMLITGSYTDYMQLGNSARLNPVINCDQEFMFDYWSIMMYMNTKLSQDELAQQLSVDLPNYEWATAQYLVDQNVGGIQEILKQTILPMTAMLCAVIMLITLLMEKLFIAREKGEIAMMKSVGFSYRTICSWQMIRMSLVVVTSMIISIPMSYISNRFLLQPIFAIMGAEVSIQVEPLLTYIIFPGILLVGILIATMLAARGIRHINIREMNNLE